MNRYILSVVLLLSVSNMQARIGTLYRAPSVAASVLRMTARRDHKHSRTVFPSKEVPTKEVSVTKTPNIIEEKDSPEIGLAVIDNSGTSGDQGCKKPQEPFAVSWESKGVSRDVTKPWIAEFMGIAKRDQIEKMAQVPEIKEAFIKSNGREITNDDIDAMHNTFAAVQLEVILNGFPVIKGVQGAEQAMKYRNILLGSSTGYDAVCNGVAIHKMTDQGVIRDFSVVPYDVCAGRPGPWMIQKNRELAWKKTGRYIPSHETIKFDDTCAGVQEGVNDGCWSVGVCDTGIRVNLDEEEEKALEESNPLELARLRQVAAKELYEAGAHVVIPSCAMSDSVVGFLNQCMKDPACRPQNFAVWAADNGVNVHKLFGR